MSTAPRAIYDQPKDWEQLQKWVARNDDPLRPWNISAIGRRLGLPQSIVRAMLKAPKGADGMSRTAFTGDRLRLFQRLFRNYEYRVRIAEDLPADDACRSYRAAGGSVRLAAYAFVG